MKSDWETKQSYYRQIYYFAQLMRNQWLKKSNLITMQEKKLQKLVHHAYHNVPYYHKLFDSEMVRPENIKTIDDLERIPILSKESVRKNFPQGITTQGVDTEKCHTSSTTGSTGMPMKVIFNSKAHDFLSAVVLFVFLQCGLRLTDKLITIRHAAYQSSNDNPLKRLLQKVGILNWENIPIFTPIEEIVEILKNRQPDVISTFPSMHMLLCEEINKLYIKNINPRLVFSTGETLTERNKQKIINHYNSEICGWYGSVEFGHLAFECRQHSGYHMISDTAIIELIKEGKKVNEGEEGEIVVTTLNNFAMPLIRYNLGDIGVFSQERCACGRGYPLLKTIEGRKDDFIILPSGRKISPRNINVIEDIPGVFSYKTIQTAKDRILVNLVKGDQFSEQTISDIKKHIKSGCYGEEVNVEVKLVKELPRNARGKLRAVVSNIRE